MTDKQELDFLHWTGESQLQNVVDFIAAKLDPEDVFDDTKFETWARCTFTVPEELFPVEDLEQWAINNGWTNQDRS